MADCAIKALDVIFPLIDMEINTVYRLITLSTVISHRRTLVMKNLVIDHHKFIVGQRLVAMLARKTVRVIYMSCAKGQASTGNLLLTLSTDTTGGIGPCGSHG